MEIPRRVKARGLVALAAASLALCGCRGGDVTAYRLQKDAEQVSSIATDAALTAHATRTGEAPSAYTRVHASELGKEAGKLASVLGRAHAPPPLAGKTRTVVALAKKLSAELEGLQHNPGDRRLAGQLERSFDRTSKRASSIAKQA
jgi:hypothetical protein